MDAADLTIFIAQCYQRDAKTIAQRAKRRACFARDFGSHPNDTFQAR
jgi:hypothetical protein